MDTSEDIPLLKRLPKNAWIILFIHLHASALGLIIATLSNTIVLENPNITDESEVIRIISVFFAGKIIGAVLWPTLQSRGIPRKHFYKIGLVLASLGLILTISSQEYTIMMVGQFLCGLGSIITVLFTPSMLMDMVPAKDRGQAMSLMGITTVMGIVLGVIMPSFFKDRFGYKLPLILLLILIFLQFIVSFKLEEPKLGSQEEQLSEVIESGSKYDDRVTLGHLKKLFKIRSNIIFAVCFFLFFFMRTASNFLLVNFQNEFGLTGFKAMLVVMGGQFSMFIGTIYLGPKSDKNFKHSKDGKIKMLIVCMFLYPAFAILANSSQFLLHKSLVWIFLYFGLALTWSFFFGGTNVIPISILGDTNPPELRPAMMGSLQFCGLIGDFTSSLILAEAFEVYGSYKYLLILWYFAGIIAAMIFASSKKIILHDMEKMDIYLKEKAVNMKNNNE